MFSWKKTKSKNKQSMLTNLTAYFVLLAAVGATAFFGVCNPQSFMQETGTINGDAATVDGERITLNEFKRDYERVYQQYSQTDPQFDPGSAKLAENVLNRLVEAHSISRLANTSGFVASQAEAEETIVEGFKTEKSEFSRENFAEALRSNGYTESSYIEALKREITTTRFRRFFVESGFYASAFAQSDFQLGDTKYDLEFLKFVAEKVKISVTKQDIDAFLTPEGKKQVETYYQSHTSEFKREAQVKARHILISYKDARRPAPEAEKRTKDEARKLADEVLKKVHTPGADFSVLARIYTEEPNGKNKGGDLGYFKREDMVKEFSDVAFSLKVGEVSSVVETPFGFHIIKVSDVMKAMDQNLEQATPSIAETLITEQRKPEALARRANEVMETLIAGKNSNQLLTEYDVAWKETGEFSAEARSIPNLGSDAAFFTALEQLKKVGDVYPKVVEVSGSKYILKLKKIHAPDMSQFDVDKQKDLARQGWYSMGGTMFKAITDDYHDSLKKAGKIHLNKSYLALDQRRKKAEGEPQ